MLEKVAEPERKAPNMPTIGETHAQTAPMLLAKVSARATGIEANPEVFSPEFRKIFTMGTDAPREIMVGTIDLHDTLYFAFRTRKHVLV